MLMYMHTYMYRYMHMCIYKGFRFEIPIVGIRLLILLFVRSSFFFNSYLFFGFLFASDRVHVCVNVCVNVILMHMHMYMYMYR